MVVKSALPAVLGARLRRLRRERGWTLEELAAATDLSLPYLSRLEAGHRQPSLAALLTLARTYRRSVSELLGEHEPALPGLVRAVDAPVQDADGLRLLVLTSPGAALTLQAFRAVVSADRPVGQLRTHAGQEWLHVLSGRLRLTLAVEQLDVEPGDAVGFDARVPHRLAAADGGDVELVLVVHEPSGLLAPSCLAATGGAS